MKEIICGFAGVGKSTLAKKRAGYVDLESTPFKKDWDLYSDVAIHMAKSGYTVMVSCHLGIRQALKQKEVNYKVYSPVESEKYRYLQNYKDRGDDESFLKMFETNFYKFIKEISETETNVFWLHGRNLEDGLNLTNK